MKTASDVYREDQISASQIDQVEKDQPGSIKWVFNPIIRLDPGTETGGLHPRRGEHS
jgi:hypothetical protein